MRARRSGSAFVRTLAFHALVLGCAGPSAAQVTLVSRAADDVITAAGGAFHRRGISHDGRFVAFTSKAPTVAPQQDDTNGVEDVFLLDRLLGTVRLVSHVPDTPRRTGNGQCEGAVVSGDGAFVAFASRATDLVPGSDTNSNLDIYLFEVATGTVTLVSHAPGLPTTTANGWSYGAAISVDGRRVAYQSQATNLVTGQSDVTATFDVFLFDRPTGETVLVSHAFGQPAARANDESLYPKISDDGRYVAFQSEGTNLVSGQSDVSNTYDVFLYDHETGASTVVNHTASSAVTTAGTTFSGGESNYSMSADGAFVAFVSGSTGVVGSQWDDNSLADVFLFRRDDPPPGNIALVSHRPGEPARTGNSGSSEPLISADGSWVAFNSQALDLAGTHSNYNQDAFVFERASGTVTLVSHAAGSPGVAANSQSIAQAISGDGRYVSFDSTATNLVAGATDVNSAYDAFLWDRLTGNGTLVSHAQGQPLVAGTPGLGGTAGAGVNRSGDVVLFYSVANDVVLPGDNNGTNIADVVAYDVASGVNALVAASSPASPSVTAAGISQTPSVSADGRFVAFVSDAPNLVAGQVDGNRAKDVFLFDRDTGTVALVSHVPGSAVTSGDGASGQVAISADGDFVAFLSRATNLVTGTDTNLAEDLFLYDRSTQTVRLVSHVPASVTTTGNAGVATSGGFAVSGDGAWIAFSTTASNLISGGTDTNAARDVFLYERSSELVSLVSHAAGLPATAASAASDWPVVSGDGNWIAFQSLGNNLVAGYSEVGSQVYLFGRVGGVTTLASHASGAPTTGANASSFYPALPFDGAHVAYESSATDLAPSVSDSNFGADIYVYSRLVDTNTLVSHLPSQPLTAGNGLSSYARISGDGNWIAFYSRATNLVGGADTNSGDDVFLYDRVGSTVTLVSRKAGSAVDAGNTNVPSARLSIAADGSRVGFSSHASDLVVGGVDPNRFSNEDTFVFERASGLIRFAGHVPGVPTRAADDESTGTLSANGAFMAVSSKASNLITGDGNGVHDVYLVGSACQPGAPSGLSAVANGNNRIDLAWTSPGASVYEVIRSRFASGPFEVVGTSAGAAYMDTPVDGGVTYYYLVRNYCGQTNQASAVGLGACSRPPDFGGATSAWHVPGTTCAVQLTWAAATSPCGGAVTFSVYRGTDPGFLPGPANRLASPVGGTSHVDSAGLNAGFTFYYVVRAITDANGEEDGNAIRQSAAIPAGSCSAGDPLPVAFFNASGGDGRNTLDWVDPGGAYEGTHVTFTSDGSAPSCPGSTPVPGSPFTGSSGSPAHADHTGLANGTTYRYSACVEASSEFSAARTTFARPDSPAQVKWGYATGAAALATVGVIPNERYYVPSNDRVLHSVGAGSAGGSWPVGPPEWTPVLLGAPVQSRPTVIRLPVTRIAGADTVVFVGSQDGRVQAIDADTGNVLWTSAVLGAAVQAAPSAVISDFAGSENLVLVGSREPTGRSKLFALNLQTGASLWVFDNDGGPAIGIISAQAQVSYPTQRVYFTSRRSGGGSQDTVWCLDYSTSPGTRLWSVDVGDVDAAPVLRGGVLYVGNNAGEVRALDPGTGAIKWTRPGDGDGPVKGYVWPDSATGRLYFSTNTAVRAIVDQGTSFSQFWSTPVAVSNTSPPLLWSGRLYVGGGASRLYSIDATSPTPAAPTSVVLGDPAVPKIIGSPTLDTASGLVVVGSDQGVVYAVATPF